MGNDPIAFADPTGLSKHCNILKNLDLDSTYEVGAGYWAGEDFAYADPQVCGGGGFGSGGDCGTLDGTPLPCSTGPDTGFPIGGGQNTSWTLEG